ncbi:MAG: nitronate monooxygenase [Bacteroidales bacterium]
MENRICKLFGIKHPIVSGGMVWCSGWRLASAVSKCGGLGLIGAGSMHPDNLRYHIRACRAALIINPDGTIGVPFEGNAEASANAEAPANSEAHANSEAPSNSEASANKDSVSTAVGKSVVAVGKDLSGNKNKPHLPFGVNVPLMYPQIEVLMNILVEEGVKIVFTSAGSPKKWTPFLKEHGITVCHVASSSIFAKKCEEAGVDAVVAEGFEAGGHNGREETTTLCLIPAVREATTLPLIAAGGIALRCQIKAVEALGAEGVQIGTRFALSTESSAHENFKNHCMGLEEGATKLLLKKISPTRLAPGDFTAKVQEMEDAGATKEELTAYLGKGRAKQGIFEGNLIQGELEIGQICNMVRHPETVEQIMEQLTHID